MKKEDSLAFFREAWSHGINFFDSAEGYLEGKGEETLGIAFKELGWERSDFVVVTKIYWGGVSQATGFFFVFQKMKEADQMIFPGRTQRRWIVEETYLGGHSKISQAVTAGLCGCHHGL